MKLRPFYEQGRNSLQEFPEPQLWEVDALQTSNIADEFGTAIANPLFSEEAEPTPAPAPAAASPAPELDLHRMVRMCVACGV